MQKTKLLQCTICHFIFKLKDKDQDVRKYHFQCDDCLMKMHNVSTVEEGRQKQKEFDKRMSQHTAELARKHKFLLEQWGYKK